MGEHVSPELHIDTFRGTAMWTPRRRRQEGLIREALYIFLAVAIVMAALLDGFAIFTAQQNARGDASDAGLQAKQEYVQSGDIRRAEQAAKTLVEAAGGTLVDFSTSAGTGFDTRSFTVTVKYTADTYLFHYLGFIPGLGDWVEDVENPRITRTTS